MDLTPFDFCIEPSTSEAIPVPTFNKLRVPGVSSTLEAMAWSALSWPQLVSRSAAWVREQSRVRGTINYTTGAIDLRFPGRDASHFLRQLSEALVFTREEAAQFESDVRAELERQVGLCQRREFARLMPPKPSRAERVHEAATAVFGPAGRWFNTRDDHLQPTPTASYTMLRHYPPNVVLAVVEGGKPYKTQAMVYRVRGFAARAVRLPGLPKNLNELIQFLGLKKVTGRGPIRIDWLDQSFVVCDYLVVPWTRY